MEMLNEAMAKQRAEITRLRDVLHLTGTGKVLLALICLVLCYKTELLSAAFRRKHLAEEVSSIRDLEIRGLPDKNLKSILQCGMRGFDYRKTRYRLI